MTNHATIAHIGPHMKDSKSIANSNWLACAYHMGHMLMTMVFAEQYIQTINQTYTTIYYMHIDMYTYKYIYTYIYTYINTQSQLIHWDAISIALQNHLCLQT